MLNGKQNNWVSDTMMNFIWENLFLGFGVLQRDNYFKTWKTEDEKEHHSGEI